MDCGVVGTAAAGIVNATVTSISQRLFLVSGAEAVNPQQYQQARGQRMLPFQPIVIDLKRYPSHLMQVCRELVDTKSQLDRATQDVMTSQAAYRALEEQVGSFSLQSLQRNDVG
jgi:hypothetical protein